ncbi:unnamed protein product [Paramecium pentaurelia]|uniref:Uncharacterized protein n=1 Tax=Paramecium pentaurelia TaxID=43138 RepID=A0A8S1RVK0_9CILI|nr:unnamed protein product [Paramecium pentaurelia]
MFINQEHVIKCPQHNHKKIKQFCTNQSCQIETKIFCSECRHEHEHMCCKSISIKNIPKQVMLHDKLYKEILESINDLEKCFLEKTKFIKSVVCGYQIDEIYQYITNFEDLNSLVNRLRTLPNVSSEIKQISNNIKDILQVFSTQKINYLVQHQKEELRTTILQRIETT